MSSPGPLPEALVAGSSPRNASTSTQDTRRGELTAFRLAKSFDGVPVLRGVTTTFLGGTVHALIGANGAGKSTLLKLLSGAIPVDSGTIYLDGDPVVLKRPRDALSRGIYRVPQEPVLVDELTVGENLFLGVLPRRSFSRLVSWEEVQRRSEEVLSRLDLRIRPSAVAKDLSIAEQQLVECARALVHECRAILFDEPTSPLTHHEVLRLFDVIALLRGSGCAIGFISHRLDEVFEVSDHVSVLRDGQLVASAPCREADRSELVTAMIGRRLKAKDRARGARSQVGPLTGPSLLEVRGLSAPPRFRSVSFTLLAGEILGLGGLVGSGRTEVAEAVVGLRARDGGRVFVQGKELRKGGIRAAVAEGVIYVPEDRAKHSIFAGLGLAENISAGDLALIKGVGPLIDPSKESANAATTVTALGIKGPGLRSALRHFSGGNQQKSVLGRWLLTKPRVAILDEPTRGIDAGAKQEIYELLERLSNEGLGIVVISSETEELARLCDRVLVLFEGRCVAELQGLELTAAAIGRAMVDPPDRQPPGTDVAPLISPALPLAKVGLPRVLPLPERQLHALGFPGTPRRRRLTTRLVRSRELVLLAFMVLLSAGVGTVHPDFVSLSNIQFILASSVVLGLVAIGETIVLLGRGLDLSVAPVMGLGAVVTGVLANSHGLNLAEAVPLALAIGAVLGAVNGIVVTVFRVPPIITTLGTLFVYSGIVFIYLNGQEVDQMPAQFTTFGNGYALPGLQIPVLLLIVVTALAWLVVRHTALGRAVLSIGGASEAARNAGLPVRLVSAMTYVLSGALAAFAGLVYVSYTGYAVATTGTGTDIELTAIAAALIGGTSIAGGRGGPVGTALGSVFLSVALGAVVSLHIPAIWEPAGEGVIILAAVGIDALLARRSQLRQEVGQ